LVDDDGVTEEDDITSKCLCCPVGLCLLRKGDKGTKACVNETDVNVVEASNQAEKVIRATMYFASIIVRINLPHKQRSATS
jgi:hypothetical protein